jgi:small-conductance mechanosensitive channel
MVLGVVSRILAVLIFFIGLYLVLQLAGLTGLAATVISGTGVAGIVAGIAFRDILENYLAGMLISLRNPFRLNDLVDIGGYVGIVQRVTSRSTVLMDMDGNHVQIPNATVYKSIIQNFTANPNRRLSFGVGIGYDADIASAQDIALEILQNHPYVISDPEPVILAETLGAATINLTVYFWYDGTTHNGSQIKSSLIRMVKIAYQENDISMPDEAREIVFPEGIPVQLTRDEKVGKVVKDPERSPEFIEKSKPPQVTTGAEGEIGSEAEQIKEQGRRARSPEDSPNLLEK